MDCGSSLPQPTNGCHPEPWNVARDATEGKKPRERQECRSWHGPSPALRLATLAQGTLSPLAAGRGAINLARRKPRHLSNLAQRKLYGPSPRARGEGAEGG